MRFLFIIDPIETLNPERDSTLPIMWEAQTRGHTIAYATVDDLCIKNGIPHAETNAVTIHEDKSHFSGGNVTSETLQSFEVIFMRKDPPLTIGYITATHILSLVDDEKTLFINNPRSLRDFNEKLSALQFGAFTPPSLVAKDHLLIKKFIQDHEEVVIKPLYRSGGAGVFHLKKGDSNALALMELLTNEGREFIMVQKYLPEAREGDKRILLLDGEILGAVVRVPAPEDHRGNFHAGATCKKALITPTDKKICATLKPWLKKHGLIFTGIDVIGTFLTEINVTSPTCIQEINALEHVRLESKIIDWIEQRNP